jgi:hypothetical protein
VKVIVVVFKSRTNTVKVICQLQSLLVEEYLSQGELAVWGKRFEVQDLNNSATDTQEGSK